MDSQGVIDWLCPKETEFIHLEREKWLKIEFCSEVIIGIFSVIFSCSLSVSKIDIEFANHSS